MKGTRAAVNTLMGEDPASTKYIPPISSLPNHDGYGAKNLAGIFEQSKNNWVFIGEYNPQKSDYTITDGVQPGDIVVYHSKEGPGHVATVTEVQTTPSSGGPKDGNLIVMANHPTGVFRKYEKDPENRVTIWRLKPIEEDRLRRAEIAEKPQEPASPINTPQINSQALEPLKPLPMLKTDVVSQGA